MFKDNDHTFAICAYKDSPYLKECIDSLISQTIHSHIIICTSTPNETIGGIANEYHLDLHVNTTSTGIGSDWNHAILQANTPLVTIAHQDDVYCSDYGEKMLAAMNANERPLIFASDYGELRDGRIVDSNQLLQIKRMLIYPMKRKGVATTRFQKRNILRFGSSISCPSVTYNKETIPQPLFEEGLSGGLDWAAWERLSDIEGSFCYDPNILMYHRIHEGSETSRIIADQTRIEEDLIILERFWPKPIARVINRLYSKGLKSNDATI